MSDIIDVQQNFYILQGTERKEVVNTLQQVVSLYLPLSPTLPDRGSNQAEQIETNNMQQVQGNPLLQMKH
jgi:hypothetical protein